MDEVCHSTTPRTYYKLHLIWIKLSIVVLYHTIFEACHTVQVALRNGNPKKEKQKEKFSRLRSSCCLHNFCMSQFRLNIFWHFSFRKQSCLRAQFSLYPNTGFGVQWDTKKKLWYCKLWWKMWLMEFLHVVGDSTPLLHRCAKFWVKVQKASEELELSTIDSV
jgi:hypothetical protein